MATHMLDAPAAPSYQPQGPSGNERITVNPTPDAFGASMNRAEQGLGHAMGEAGAAAFKVSDFYSQVAGDDAYYKLQDFGNKLIHGDPSAHATGPDGQPIMGPDGKPMPDTGFMGTRGADTLRRWQEVKQTFDKKVEEIRGGLMSDQQRHAFDRNSRRLRSTLDNQIGSHADQQMKVYGQTTNEAAARTALTTIGLNPDDEGIVKENTEALRHTYTKQVQLSGGGDEAMKDAIARADRDALTARVQMIGVNDPMRAQKLLDDNKDVAGPAYIQMSEHLRHRNDQAVGEAAAQKALGTARTAAKGAPPLPVFVQAAQSVPGAMSPQGMVRLTQIEFGGGQNNPNNPKHQGPVQASPDYWARFGAGGDRNNWQDALAALARSTAADRPVLAKVLGRDPTDAELYLSHQQGIGGASALLRNPDMNAVDALAQAYGGDKAKARAAIVANGGDPNGTAADFSGKWIGKFGGVAGAPSFAPGGGAVHVMPASVSGFGPQGEPAPQPGAPPPTLDTGAIAHANVQAAAYAQIMADPTLNPQQRQMALSRVTHEVQAEAIRDAATTKAKKELNDAAANEYVTSMVGGKAIDLNKIANDQRLDWHTKEHLAKMAETAAGPDGMKAARAYGEGFWPAYQSILAPPDTPGRISDVTELYKRAGPGGDLTLAGVEKLTHIMQSNRKSVADQAVNQAKAGLIAYAKDKLSFDQEALAGGLTLKDPKGRQIFQGQFIPAFEAAYDKWVKDGKDPWLFLTRENVDKMAEQMRSKTDLQNDRLSATGEAPAGLTPTPGGKGPAAVPPPPQGVDAAKWTKIVAAPPPGADGKAAMKLSVWSQAVTALLAKPTPANIAAFNNSPFGKGTMKAEAIIKELSGK